MPTYLFYPRRADGVSLTFIANAAQNDLEALQLAVDVAAAHDCVGVFVWEPATAADGKDRFVGEVERRGAQVLHRPMPERGASAPV
ncbi:hypothetical protein [Caulobacter sp. FWC2]|uniref:hypothetical protein n=1 Tax=Caulobacter sp. FWC2 TaxID=69664 RepID=UPI0018EB90CF|nr:hypothetical protein [Caulobacter sp. FWC2]